MGKTHNVYLKITNNTDHVMTYKTDWFDSGQLADGYDWPQISAGGGEVKVLCYEKDDSGSGCSGYVTYTMGGTDVTIAFSNPVAGTNKLYVGTNGKGVWDEMGDNNYGRVGFDFYLSNGVRKVAFCKCSGGSTNDVEIEIENTNASADYW